jgi:hypothetical protein
MYFVQKYWCKRKVIFCTVLSRIPEISRAKACLLCVNRKLHATSTRKGVLQLLKKEKMGEDYINTEKGKARTKK